MSEFSKHLAPVARYEAIGIGSGLAKFLCANMYGLFMNVDEAAQLAVFMVKECIEHVDGCEGPISLLHWKVGTLGWSPCHPGEVQKILDQFKNDKLRESLMNYWKQLTPQIARPVEYNGLQQGDS